MIVRILTTLAEWRQHDRQSKEQPIGRLQFRLQAASGPVELTDWLAA
jgi:hypothetical protein